MKNAGRKWQRNRGFTLMELMVVISLIAILAGMVMAAMPAVLNQIKRKQVKLTMKELEAGLSSYKLDNGMYPVNEPVNPQNAILGGSVLYKYLSGDFDEDGFLDDEKDNRKIYMEGIDYNTAKNQPQQRVGTTGNGKYALVDPFGNLIRYLCEPPGKKNKQTRNPTYDLWSLGGADAESNATEDLSRWITNWGE